MASAWVYQKVDQVAKLGEAKASWYVGWYDPDGHRHGKSCGGGQLGKDRAERMRRKLENDLMTGNYQLQLKKTWEEFLQEYESRILSGLAPRSRPEAVTALEHFRRLVKPVRVFAIQATHIDAFVAARREEHGKKKGSKVSPATVNKDLRHIKAALRVAVDWGYLARLPRFRMEKETKKLPTYVTGEHFAAIYKACDQARRPAGLAFPAADWWRGLIVMGYMTGWRISDMLSLRREDLDLEAGTAITRGPDNKGKRDERVKLHPVVVEHLKRLPGFDPCVFPWNQNRRTLDVEFASIQTAAGVHLVCPERHEHTAACHVYGFHDFRRAFATMNADKLTADALQSLMRHKSYQTTQVYINLSRQMDEAVASLHVPEVLRTAAQ